MTRRTLTVAMALSILAGCDDGELRGHVSASADGKTYLAVADDNGGMCGPLLVDGQPWKHPLGQRVEIAPGPHRIGCGIEETFTIRAGTVYEFDYWGP
jgi:hypothetical protein